MQIIMNLRSKFLDTSIENCVNCIHDLVNVLLNNPDLTTEEIILISKEISAIGDHLDLLRKGKAAEIETAKNIVAEKEGEFGDA